MTKKLSKAQEFAAWKAKRREDDMRRAELKLATSILTENQKGNIPVWGRGWKKWAERIIKL